MNREKIHARQGEIAEEMLAMATRNAELTAELKDLDAALRVIDRMEGKAAADNMTIAKALIPPSKRINGKGVLAGLPQQKTLAEMFAAPEMAERLQLQTTLVEKLSSMFKLPLPDKQMSLPEAIHHAMNLMFLEDRSSVTPKEVEAFIAEMGLSYPNQNVNSIMWRMAQRGELEKASDAPLYSLPKSKKASADEYDPNEL